MKTKRSIKKFISTLLTVAVILAGGLFAAAPEPAYAMNTTDLINHIKNFDHGGTGSLSARFSMNGSNIIHVSGTVTGATNVLSLDIDSGVTVQWAADYSGSVNQMIILSGAGTFEVASGSISNSGSITIQLADSSTVAVKVSGGTVRNTGNGPAISGFDSGNNNITVSGGTVSAAVYTISVSGNVTVSGGTVSSTSVDPAISLMKPSGTVTVSGGTVSAQNGHAIYCSASSSAVNISGNSFVFANKASITGGDNAVISNAANISSNAVVCAWNKPGGTPTYTEGTANDLAVNSGATAKWGISGSQTGINYSNGTNSGFFPINGITVSAAPATYTVTVNGGTGSNNYAAGATVNIAANPAQAGKVFDKWAATGVTLSSPGSANTSFTMPANAVTVTATYKDAVTYTITFKYDNGEPDSVQTVNAGDKADYGMDPVKEGYTFAGWCSDAACTTAYNFNTPVTSNITLYAKWTGGAFTISVSSDEGGTAKANATSAIEGDTVTLTVEEDEGYMFKEWQIVSGHVVIYGDEFTMPGENVVIKAVFELISGEDGTDADEPDDTATQGNAGSNNLLLILVIILAAAAAGGLILFIMIRKKDKAQPEHVSDHVSMEDGAPSKHISKDE